MLIDPVKVYDHEKAPDSHAVGGFYFLKAGLDYLFVLKAGLVRYHGLQLTRA